MCIRDSPISLAQGNSRVHQHLRYPFPGQCAGGKLLHLFDHRSPCYRENRFLPGQRGNNPPVERPVKLSGLPMGISTRFFPCSIHYSDVRCVCPETFPAKEKIFLLHYSLSSFRLSQNASYYSPGQRVEFHVAESSLTPSIWEYPRASLLLSYFHGRHLHPRPQLGRTPHCHRAGKKIPSPLTLHSRT